MNWPPAVKGFLMTPTQLRFSNVSGRGPTLAGDAVDTLTTPPTTRDATLYPWFPHAVLRTSGPGFLFMVSGLGKQRVARLAEKEKTGLVRRIKNHSDTFNSSSLQPLAKECPVPSVNSLSETLPPPIWWLVCSRLSTSPGGRRISRTCPRRRLAARLERSYLSSRIRRRAIVVVKDVERRKRGGGGGELVTFRSQ
ncbi:hypothetical protein BJ875DRAFT_488302 [Amylocarpus encephaloides]|uniref:Uncharacterized protein n=1 Tax=Amylocarpus encephaloides TaxID=45428 RepID=A0A9P8C1P0_9HELO|nr:hypothetical protein BJ875DRAFT_488302 [Amylocarpus encephaloides]